MILLWVRPLCTGLCTFIPGDFFRSLEMWRPFSPFLNASDNTGAFARYHPMIATRAAIRRLGFPDRHAGPSPLFGGRLARSNMFLAACTGADTFFAGSERQNKTGVFASYHPMTRAAHDIRRLGPPTAILGRALWWAPRSNMLLAACTGAETFSAGSERRR